MAEDEKLSSLVILELAPTTDESTRLWFVSRLAAPKSEAGADLLVEAVESVVHEGSYLLHLGATRRHLEAGAEEVGVRKLRLDTGEMREYDSDEVEFFTPLTEADILRVVKHDLDNLRAVVDEKIPGLPGDSAKALLYPGKSIVRRLRTAGVITQSFPLHQPESLKTLKSSMMYHVPFVSRGFSLDEVRDYFGDTIAIYFAFLKYFAMGLLPVVLVALPYYAFGGRKDFEAFLFFAIYNLIWATLLVEIWKRRQARLACGWGTLSLVQSAHEEPRAGYHGPLRQHPVTGKLEPHASAKSRYLKIFFVSCPTIIICMVVAACFMELYFYFEEWAMEAYELDPSTVNNIVTYLPSIVYSIVIFLSNASYRPLAHRLTEFENHRTETQHLYHLVLKVLVFDSFNCFGALFYVAFWLRDIPRLRADLASLLIMSQILEQLQETVMPYYSTWKAQSRFAKGKKATAKMRLRTSSHDRVVDEATLIRAETEADMPPYEGTFDDYLELFLHFGYISLFSCVYPLASIWAFANNVMETRTDGFKFVAVHQRPFPRNAANIGVWQVAFEVMGALAILTNVSLIGMSKDFKDTFAGVFDQWQIFMILIAAEHVLVFLKFIIVQVIPDWPEPIRNKMFKENYESHLALKKKFHDADKVKRA